MADNTTSLLDFGVDVNRLASIITVESRDLDDTNFFGVSTDDQESAVSETEPVILDDDKIVNPFYVSTAGGQLFKMETSDIYKTYDRVIVVSLSKNYNPVHQHLLMQKYLNRSDLNSLRESICFHTGPMKMLKLHRKTATVVDRNYLNQLNANKNLAFNNDEIVISLFELEESDAKLYVESLFSNNYDFDSLTKLLLLFLRYNGDIYGESLKKNISRYINNLSEAGYWENSYNCNLNMTDIFMKRTFAKTIDPESKFQNKSTSELIKKIMESTGNADYLQGMDNVYKKANYVDGASATKNGKTKFKLYKIKEQSTFTKEQVTELFQIVTDERTLYDLFNNFLLSKDHCHLVLNNKQVLQIMKPTIKKFMPLYKLLFGYAWICMYTEECVKKTRSTVDDRYVFPIDVAAELPDFPFMMNDVHTSPYVSMPIAKDAIKAEENCIGLSQIKSGFDNQNAISTLEEFKRKFNVFTTGKSNKSIFDGLATDEHGKWSDFAVSGSAIAACVPKNHPLMELVVPPGTDEVEKLTRYFYEYYKNSDIDVICTRPCVYEFMDKTHELYEVIVKNVNELAGKDVSATIKINPIKSLRIAICPEYIQKCMPDHTVDNVVNNLNTSEIRDYFYFEYMNIKRRLNSKLQTIRGKNPLYSDYFKPTSYDDMILLVSPYKTPKAQVQVSNSDYCVFLNDVLPDGQKVPEDENILIFKMSEGIKFKINSDDSSGDEKYLLHGIEVFKSKYQEVFSIVSRFHLPCVRGYYCGNDVKLLPSCVSAYKTGINGDYKYMTGGYDPIHIIDKYRTRGFGIILNKTEIRHMVEYNKDAEEWKGVFKIDPSNVGKHLGQRTMNDDMFKLGKHREGLNDDNYRKIDYTYINNTDDLYAVYKEKFGYDPKKCGLDLLMMKTINNDGTVRPFNRSLLDVTYDLLK
jgi:hypothetical protein